MERVFRQVKTSPFGRISARQAHEADLFFEELTGVATGMRPREYWRTGSGFSHESYNESAALEDDFRWYDFAGETVSIDTAAAIPHFISREKTNVLTPLLSASDRTTAVNWNNIRHAGRSGVTKAEIRQALNNYVDFSVLARAMSSGTKTISSNSDEALVEGIHQFQKKCYLNSSQVDGKAGESTLDSLGLIARTGLRTVNRVNRGRAAFLRLKSADIRRLSRSEFSYSTWFNFMVNPSFLGYRFTKGVHLHFVRALRVAEQHLLSLSAYTGKTPVQIGTALGINEIHKGARPTATSRSMHTLGLAADINYLTSPWIVNPGNTSGTRDFIAVMERATKLISGWTGRVDAAYLHGLGSGGRSTANVYDELKRRSGDLRQYLALAGNQTALTAALAARRAAGTPGSYTDVAAWSRQIAADLRTLTSSGGNFGSSRNPRLGFLGLHRDLVVALRDAACMAWGAIDFGPNYSGDVMHFDLRRTGLGQELNEAGFRTPVSCPVVSTAAGTAAGVSAAGKPEAVPTVEQILSPGTNILMRATYGSIHGVPELGRSANGALYVPAEEPGATGKGLRRANSVVEALQSLRQQMDTLDDIVRTRPPDEARQMLDWGQRRLELALNDLLERRPVREPDLLEQLIALTAPRLPYTQISTKPSAVENILSESLPSPQRVRLPIPTTSSGVATFWGSVRATNAREQTAGKMAVYVDGELLYAAFPPSIMRVIHRTSTELFGTTVAREVAAQNLRTAINGNMFDVSSRGKIDIGWGHDPVPASATSPIGQVVSGGKVVSGSSQPNRFYLACNLSWAAALPSQHGHPAFRLGMGNPPVGSGGADTAMGGLGPIIIGGLRYGVGNRYRAGVPSGAPGAGPVSSTFRPFLVQRNNNTYAALQSRGAAVGKVVVAINRTEDMLLVLVQEDGGSSGMTLNTLRGKLVSIGCDDAVFGDGSDSVMLVVGGRTMIAQGSNKEEATTIGLGFT